MEYLIVFLGCALGCGMNMVCGFGFGVFCMTFFPYVMHSTMEAAALINIVTFVQAVIVCIRYRAHIHWRLILAPIASYFLFSWLSVHFAANLANDTLRMFLGGFLVLMSLYFIFIAKRVRLAANTRNGLIAGGLGGVMSGLFSVGGPPISLYLSSATEEKEAYLATIQGYYLLSNFYVTILRASNGFVTKNVLLCSALGVAGMALGMVFGTTVFKRISAGSMRKAIYAMMAISGVVMLIP